MKRLTLSLIFGSIMSVLTWAQSPVFTVAVSADSVLLGNYIKLTFTLENADARQFDVPDFEGFQVVGGPNHASSFRMVNGDVSQSVSYSYYLQPTDIGTYYIPPATIETDEGFLETEPIEINVYPNPDGIQQTPPERPSTRSFFDSGFDFKFSPPDMTPPKKSKKKRKTYRL